MTKIIDQWRKSYDDLAENDGPMRLVVGFGPMWPVLDG